MSKPDISAGIGETIALYVSKFMTMLATMTDKASLWWARRRHLTVYEPTTSSCENELQLAALQRELRQSETNERELRTKTDQLLLTLTEAQQQIKSLESELQVKCNALDDKQSQLEQMQDLLSSERTRAEEYASRCLPTRDIPSMIYYGEPNAATLGFSKITAIQTERSLFRITTDAGNTTHATFDVINGIYTPRYIGNRHTALGICEITSIGDSCSRIDTLEPGIAVKQDGEWIIQRKVKIKIS